MKIRNGTEAKGRTIQEGGEINQAGDGLGKTGEE